MDKNGIKDLKKRYLIWLYKTTKEALDKIERKFTQLEVDKFILKELNKLDKNKKADEFIGEFKTYIQNKENEAGKLRYKNGELNPDFLFLELKLKAIEKAIARELGKNSLKVIKSLYEKEMIKRILESIEHR